MNTFGDATHQFAIVDPREVRDARPRFRRNAVPPLKFANSFYCPSGRWPCAGWLLLPRSEYDLLDRYSTTLQLNVGDTRLADNVKTLKKISIVQAQCVTRGVASDRNAIYLIKVTDDRGILYNEWFQAPITAQYNIRAPAYPQTFHPASMNAGTTWTWSTMLQDMWSKMNAVNVSANLMGAWPGLPLVPTGTPEGFWFAGVPIWTAFCDVLDQLGMSVVCDPTSNTPFTIVTQGADDPAFTALQNKYSPFILDNLEWIDLGAARVPATVKVLFKRRNDIYGSEETVRYDAPYQWDMNAYYSATINAPSEFGGAVGQHYIWSDFTIRADQNSDPIPADVATANTIAQERVTQYYARAYNSGFMTQMYAGALPFKTGSMLEGVCWAQDYMHDPWQGWRTEVVRGGGAEPPWEGIWG